MNLLEEMDTTIRLLESRIPANPGSLENEKLEKALQRSIASYFRNLDMALDWNALEALYYKLVKQE